MAISALNFDTVAFECFIEGLNDPDLRVLSFSGQENVSQPFSYTVNLISKDDGLALEDLVGKAASMVFNSEGGSIQRYLHGVIASFEQAESSERFTQYQAQVVSPIQLLSYRKDSRIFQDMSVPEIIKDVFHSAGISEFEFNLSRDYQERVYCVQYRESDLNFVMRLMESEGIYFFHKHTDRASTLTLIDQPSAHPELPLGSNLAYHDTGGGLAPHEFVFGVRWKEKITTSAVTMRDYNFKKPNVDHMHLENEVDQDLRLEQYDFPGRYEVPGQGSQRISTALEALQVERRKLTAQTAIRRLAAGYRFTLTDHHNDRFNREYIISSISHTGYSPQALEQDQGDQLPKYECEFTAVPANIALRPNATARIPVVDGIQSAIVVGPPGEEIYVDEYARVKVQFHWDRLGQFDEKSSCWLRVSQTSAGAGWGALDIPRIGHEVLVSFIEGDPDRPVITGRVYNGSNRPPNDLPNNKLQMSMKSNSSPGGGGSNELTFNDTKGEEGVYFHSQYNLNQETGYNESRSVGNNQSISIATNRDKTVGGDQNDTVSGNMMLSVGANQTVSVGANHSEEIGASKVIKAGSDVVIDAGSSLTLKCGASTLSMTSGGIVTLSGTLVNVTGMAMTNVAAPITTVSGAAALQMTGALTNISGGKVGVQGIGSVSVKGGVVKLN